ncbi:glycine zipper family protein [Tropicimonas sp. IMCC6043]|uniref:glycine zipper family protein n=1 Tax=Tropicimonas sp. IMCC6043 TaxID=2510645 RepID=UPI00101BA2FC|nr:glycine zipper family protein [Tropicimonas sp. IMCC6043]RYH11558.1 glycine zipper family protein [Tropicimonas sp. IMCC6043]
MRLAKSISTLALAGLTAACVNSGSSYQPVIDGAVGPNYSNDLAACQSLAEQQGAFAPSTGGQMLGAAAVAAGGTALFANQGTNVRDAALIGAGAGAVSGAVDQQRRKETIIANCMRGRGYNVVR